MANKRAFNRHQLISYLSVFHYDNGEPIGHLADISLAGGLLISKTRIPTREQFTIAVTLPEEGFEQSHFAIEIESVRANSDAIEDDHYDIGFLFINLNIGQEQIIRHIIERHTFLLIED